jgi:putative ABC transport system permease protein
MWVVLGNVLAARRRQAVIVALVALLACAALAAAPSYAVRATQQAGVSAVEGATVEERLISVTWLAGWRGSGDTTSAVAIDGAREQFQPSGFTSVVGGSVSGDLIHGTAKEEPAEVHLAVRENVCEHLVVTGDCPSRKGDVALPSTLAGELALKVGDELQIEATDDKPLSARVSGIYRVVDPGEPYWGDGDLVSAGSDTSSDRATVFTVSATLQGQERVTYTYDLLASPQAFATMDMDKLATRLDNGLSQLREEGYSASTMELDGLIDRIARDRRNVTAGVGVGIIVLLLLTWFALAVVVREGGVQIRGDVGWWRLRGAPSGRGWILVLGQSVVPLLVGAVVGTVVGLGIGRVMVGTLDGGAGGTALLLSLVLVGLTLAGGLVAVVAAQVGTLFTPVRDLLRRIPVRRPRWRRSVVDLVLVGLATYGVVQALVIQRDVEGLPLLAPALAALGIALITAWAVPPLATWLAVRARQSGRLAGTLIAALMARRPETHRLFALVVVAVALVTTAFVGWDTGSRTQWQRAALEVGADRVVTVAADDVVELMEGVRAVDPDGTQAMAVVEQPGISYDPSILAVDSSRLNVVAGWRDAYGGDVDKVAAALQPTEPKPVVLTTDQLELKASATHPGGSAVVHLRVRLRAVKTGKPVDAIVGPLRDKPETYATKLRGCASGCRLVGLQVLGPERPDAISARADDAAAVGHGPAPGGTQVELYPTTGSGGSSGSESATSLARLLSEPTRWRPAVGPRDLGPAIAAGEDDALRLTVSKPPKGVPVDRSDWAYVADTPAPLPVVVAGWQPDSTAEVRLPPLPGASVPTEIVRTASLVPRYGKVGALVDLTYADRLVPFPLVGGSTSQVWLSSSAPASIVDDLREVGLTPLRQESLSDRLAQLHAQGNAVGGRFQAVVAVVGLLLAAGVVLVDASRDRPVRAAELAALRAQGVSLRIVRAVGYGGLAAVVATAIVVGVLAGLAGAAIGRILSPGFVDGWDILPTVSLHPYPVAAAAGATAAVLGAVVFAAGAALVRRTRERP